MVPVTLDVTAVERSLAVAGINRFGRLRYETETESTNDDAAALLGEPGSGGLVIVAEFQRGGHGREAGPLQLLDLPALLVRGDQEPHPGGRLRGRQRLHGGRDGLFQRACLVTAEQPRGQLLITGIGHPPDQPPHQVINDKHTSSLPTRSSGRQPATRTRIPHLEPRDADGQGKPRRGNDSGRYLAVM